MDTDAPTKLSRAQRLVRAGLMMLLGTSLVACVLSVTDVSPALARLADLMPQSEAELTPSEIQTIRRQADPRLSQEILVIDRDDDGSVIVMAGKGQGAALRYRKLLGFWVMTEEGSWVE